MISLSTQSVSHFRDDVKINTVNTTHKSCKCRVINRRRRW